ncbi:MAG: AI-2E family transporter [Hyphomicrobiales bacterium]|nr:AI-2E family transporter [Hyphomicrobiales bacterium]
MDASSDPQRVAERTALRWDVLAHFSTIGIFILFLVAALQLARELMTPVVAAFVVAVALAPLHRRMTTRYTPSWLAALATLALLLLLIQAVLAALSVTVVLGIDKASRITDALLAIVGSVKAHAAALRLDAFLGDANPKLDAVGLMRGLLGVLTPALGEFVVFIVVLFFALVWRDDLRKSVIMRFDTRPERLNAIRTFNEIERRLTLYYVSVTAINATVGLLTGVSAILVGLPNALMLGLMAFALNYVPYIGPAAVMAILAGAGLIEFASPERAIAAPLLFLLMALVEGNFLTPRIIGASLDFNPLAVLLSLVFWVWLWGPVGGFLAAPLLIVGQTILARMVSEPA